MASHFTPQQYSEIEHKALSLPADIARLNPNGRTKTCADSLEKARIQALRTAQELTRALERPEDVIIRYAFMPIHGMCIRTALDMGLYGMLTTGGERQKSAKEMAQMLTGRLKEGPMEEASSEKTNTTTLMDERQDLIVRILRVLTAIGFVNEDDMEMYSANALTQTMTNAKYAAMIKHCFDVVLPPTTTTPAYLANESFTMPTSPSLTPFQRHHSHLDPPSSYFAYLAAHPALNVNFNTFMQGNRLARPFWGGWFLVQERLLDGFSALGSRKEVHRILMADVAGGLGHDLISLKQRFPNIVGTGQATELLLQKQPHIVEEIERKGGLGEGIRCEIYDFFGPQPVHGAYIYFHHFILHDWDDASCRQILANTAAAMKPGYSKLILNEIVLPDKGAPLQMALWDLQMMVLLGGMERTERAWRQLLSSVGLEVLGIWQPPAGSGGGSGGEGIIEAVRKGS